MVSLETLKKIIEVEVADELEESYICAVAVAFFDYALEHHIEDWYFEFEQSDHGMRKLQHINEWHLKALEKNKDLFDHRKTLLLIAKQMSERMTYGMLDHYKLDTDYQHSLKAFCENTL